MLAGGSVNGEIFIWDVSDADNPLKCSSTIDEYFHRDAITAIQWVPSTLHQPIGAPTQHVYIYNIYIYNIYIYIYKVCLEFSKSLSRWEDTSMEN